MAYKSWLTHYISTSFLTTHNTASHSQCCHQMLLTVGITYSQLGRILYILYDPDPFDFLHLSFSVLFQTDKLHVRLKRLHHMQTSPPGSTSAQINSTRDSQYFRADHSNGVAGRQREIGFNAAAFLKLGWQFGNFKPSPHELWGQKHARVQRQLRAMWVQTMNKSTYSNIWYVFYKNLLYTSWGSN